MTELSITTNNRNEILKTIMNRSLTQFATVLIITLLSIIKPTIAKAQIISPSNKTAYSFNFPTTTSTCGYSIEFKIEIKSVKIGQVYYDNQNLNAPAGSFQYSLLFTTTTTLTAGPNGQLPSNINNRYWDYNISMYSKNTKLTTMTNNLNSVMLVKEGTIIVDNTNLNNNNSYDGSAFAMGLTANTIYTDTATLKKFMYDSVRIHVNLDCLDKTVTSGSKLYNTQFGWSEATLVENGQSNVVLPIKLANFSAKNNGNQVNINWMTSSEMETREFNVEKSKDLKNWSSIAIIDAVGSSDKNTNYQTIDENPTATNYYRLKVINDDHSFEYSNVIKVITTKESEISIYPNPISDVVNIVTNNTNKKDFRVYNMNGIEVINTISNQTTTQININHLSSGIYLLKIIDLDGSVSTHKLIKK